MVFTLRPLASNAAHRHEILLVDLQNLDLHVIMAFTAMPTIYEKTRLRSHLQETLDELPNNLPRYDEIRLLGAQNNSVPYDSR